ncbi:MAG: MATE family efflux transporter [Clostridiaceae bacterium]|nr:MATE family efflux transporter [Clostridiaceae bacterium]
MRLLDFRDRSYWKLMIAFGLPIAIQNLIFNSFTLVDNILVGGLGDANIAAVGVANKLSFIFGVFLFGINSGSNIFSAQFWGKKDLAGVRKVLGLSLMFGLGVSIPFALGGIIFPGFIVSIFSDNPDVIREGAIYLSIVAWTYPISAVSSSFSIQSRGVGRTKVPLAASAVALTLNAILDYVLIYGKLGLPMMGVKGAAIATLVAKIVECLIIIGITYAKKYELAAKLSDFKGYNTEFMLRFIKPVSPVILNELLWAVGVTVYAYFYGEIGTEALATVQILDVINGIFVSLFMGIGNACGAIIGNLIGAGEDDTARVYAKRSVLVGIVFSAVMAVLLLKTSHFFLSFFNISQTTLEICKITIRVYAAFMIPKMINLIMIVGVCRGGGDTVFAAIIDVGAPWFIGIPMAYLGVRVFNFPVYYVVLMIQFEELTKSIFSIARLISGKWLHNLVKDFEHSESKLEAEAQAS